MMPVPNNSIHKNLILTGFMGTGKSALGRQLSVRWNRPFYDTDEMVEKLAGCSIVDIFAKYGEEHFRSLEKKVVEQYFPESGAVIACGGGLIIPKGMVELVRSKGIVVTLFASVETIIRRISGNSRRPLASGENLETKVRNLIKLREQIYMKSGIAVFTDGRSLQQLSVIVERVYERESRALLNSPSLNRRSRQNIIKKV